MPLILLTGYPTSGKTHRAHQLQAFLDQKISSLPPLSSSSSLRTHLISDHNLSIPRSVYNLSSKSANERSNNASEKDARATIYAAVKRVLSAKDIVILDGGNYIKGWRYQLFCEAKAMRTPCCVLHVGATREKSKEVNEARLASQQENTGSAVDTGGEAVEEQKQVDEEHLPYEPENWENLVFRYEEPNPMARWDSPLFTTIWSDALPPCEEIWTVIVGSEDGGKKTVRPNQATILKALSSEDFLYELDKSTQAILNKILEWGKDHPGEGGGEVDVGDGGNKELVVCLPSDGVGMPALQRLRRQFIGLNRKDAVTVKRIRESFIGYLNDSFENM